MRFYVAKVEERGVVLDGKAFDVVDVVLIPVDDHPDNQGIHSGHVYMMMKVCPWQLGDEIDVGADPAVLKAGEVSTDFVQAPVVEIKPLPIEELAPNA